MSVENGTKCRHGGSSDRYRGCRGCHRDRGDRLAAKLSQVERDSAAQMAKLEAEVLANSDAEANRRLRERAILLETAASRALANLNSAIRGKLGEDYSKKAFVEAQRILKELAL